MKKNYRYHLLKYKGKSSRLTCPGCGRPHCFTPYVDENDVPVGVERYGRCDHEQSCSYNQYPPYELNRQGGKVSALPKFGKRPVRRRKEPRKGLCLLPMEIVRKTLLFTTKNGYAVFYQFDIRDRCRAGKIILYNPRTDHRIKEGSVPAAMWVHSRLKALQQLPDDWTLS